MSIESYRRQIERQVADAKGGPDPDAAEREVLTRGGRPRTRGEAAPEDPRPTYEIALDRLADASRPADVRVTALMTLKQEAISHPNFDEWRPRFLDGLRSAARADDHDLRFLALETLVQYKDPFAQQALVDGLRDPSRALLPAVEALHLLSYDAHAEALDVAQQYVQNPPDEATRREALHVLAASPQSADRFAELFADEGEDTEVRRLAATTLSSVAPDTFRRIARGVTEKRPRTRGRGGAPGEATGDDALALHTRALLDLVE